MKWYKVYDIFKGVRLCQIKKDACFLALFVWAAGGQKPIDVNLV